MARPQTRTRAAALSLPDHGYHAPNENYDWGQAGGGMVAFAKFFEQVAGIKS